ncbi:chymotrypsin-2-like [Anthonomus grandis grandis]|uniref:chymotrypsin-2-like n=1 Tax=Anthonomus grandis grandis TaxID=2921223 RepID=UPI0021657828|nr:chymotrypsin-2-like [Anthonomus grandis grandis]
MFKLAFTLVILGALCPNIVQSKSPPLGVRGGDNAKDGEFPYMVEIRQKGCFICGGTIINENWILTAGHCINETEIGKSGGYSIVYGTRWLYNCYDSDPDPETVINVKVLHRHPKWGNLPFTNIPSYDVGLLELNSSIPYSSLAQPIILTESQEELPIGTAGNLTGWGAAVVGNKPIQNLQKLKIAALPNEECSAKIDNVQENVYFNKTQFFCTNDTDNGACSGDSGSPWAFNGIQYGIVSWSI